MTTLDLIRFALDGVDLAVDAHAIRRFVEGAAADVSLAAELGLAPGEGGARGIEILRRGETVRLRLGDEVSFLHVAAESVQPVPPIARARPPVAGVVMVDGVPVIFLDLADGAEP